MSYQCGDSVYKDKLIFIKGILLFGRVVFMIKQAQDIFSRDFCVLPGRIPEVIQSGAVITRPNITWYYMHHCRDKQNINLSLNPWKTPHSSLLQASCCLSFVRTLEKINHIIMAPYFTWLILGLHPASERGRYFVTTPLIGWAQN